ncbi:hypothetical protein K474DRAFT_101005 [Panus rudis PR-1116 ss-1]|nr:hypothetical protein K474DRAFT_101005 [Panus rudis PR-1116 ss-1]
MLAPRHRYPTTRSNTHPSSQHRSLRPSRQAHSPSSPLHRTSPITAMSFPAQAAREGGGRGKRGRKVLVVLEIYSVSVFLFIGFKEGILEDLGLGFRFSLG